MKKFAVLLGLSIFILMPCAARAQKIQLFGGYSYLRQDTNAGKFNLNGWEASATVKNTWVGFTADFSGHYGSPQGTSTSLHTFLFGPQVSLPVPFVSPYVHALVGAARQATGNVSDTVFAAAFGGGVDAHIAPLLSYRLFQVDYLATRFGGSTQNNLRISTGLVIRF
ncbi:MAG: hypothetical protein KGL59_03065 [Acidobacteriota bacterium]|nr:hypothetical protein [Acidobacteriota bacterium]